MAFKDTLLPEFDQEMKTTRTILERVPLGNAAWKPHTKSTALGALAAHVANLAGFGDMIVHQPERDFSTWVPLPEPTTTEELLKRFDDNAAKSRAAIDSLD